MILRREGPMSEARLLIAQIGDVVAENRGREREEWYFKHGGIESYSISFHEVLGREFGLTAWPKEQRLEVLVEDIRRRKGNVNTLDLMSYGAFHVSAGLSGKAVGLCDERGESLKQEHEKTGVEFVKGDIHNSRLWARLKAGTRESGAFDLIVSRAIGARSNLLQSDAFYARTLRRVYSLLDADSGVFLAQYDPTMSIEIQEGTNILNRIPGISAQMDPLRFAFSLVRGEGAPDPRTFRNTVLETKANS